ncbi:MAG TPA: aldo/keto reductase [Acidimicrobiales bacterium]|jgi:aryl-alcohol dehydrogenase-like predicted oxidoreductase|nr:aldo/keto reductase [Acidimicrobiales bacterium]
MTGTPTAAAAGTIAIGDDLSVNRLGFGAMRITGPGIWGPPADHDEAVQVLRRAVELGVDFIDTADSYGPEVSEELIAEALFPYPEGLVIATKGGFLRPGPGNWKPDGRPEHLRAVCEGSLARLRLDQIPLYQFHRPDPTVPFEDSVGELVALRDEGKIRHIGLSNVDVALFERASALTPIVSVQNRYNPSDRATEPLIELAGTRSFAFIPWAPVGGYRPGAGDGLATVAKRVGASPVQVAIAWQLARSPQMLPIPGTSSVAHLEENIAAAAIELSDDDLAQIG